MLEHVQTLMEILMDEALELSPLAEDGLGRASREQQIEFLAELRAHKVTLPARGSIPCLSEVSNPPQLRCPPGFFSQYPDPQ